MPLRMLEKPKLSGNYLKLPDELSHYTTLNGLIGIIDNCEIWASNVNFLNDRRELVYGLDEAISVVKSFSSRKSNVEWRRPLEAAVRRLRDGEIPNTYAACFCEGSDLLSLWRAYAGEQGIVVSFNRIKLSKLLKKEKAIFVPVVYGKLKTNEQITKQLADRLDKLDNEAGAFGGYTSDQRKEKAHSLLSRLLPQFKHVGFKDEREWRFIVQQNSVRSSVFFRAKSNVLVPYIKLPLGDEDDLPINYVRIGPGRDQELTKRSVEVYLESKGYKNRIRVRVSNVPYRV